MAVYKIFPEKDATIYSEIPYSNTGRDEILEVSGYTDSTGVGRTSRTLIKFSSEDINSVVSRYIGSTNFSSSLRLFLAEANEIPVDFKVYCYPVSQSWEGGVGKFGDIPIDKSGVSWLYTNPNSSSPWSSSNLISYSNLYVQQEYVENNYTQDNAQFIEQPYLGVGGGSWVGQYELIDLYTTQSFVQNSGLDLNLNVTNPVKLFNQGTISNNGFILKLENKYEFNTTSSLRLKYFSTDTNSIYPPCLELKWDDSSYSTGSLEVLSTVNPVIAFQNSRKEYFNDEKIRFRLTAKPKYPTRSFTTSSVYLTNYALPKESYWSIRDINTDDEVIDYDPQFTKISCDSEGPYFDIYMNGLQPERYYKLLVKTSINGSDVILDNQNTFKVVQSE